MSVKLRLAAIIAIVAGVALINWSTTVSMIGLWGHSAYEHCFAIPFVSAYLLWMDRETTLTSNWSGSWLGLILLGLSMTGLYAAKVALIQLLEHFFLLTGTIAAVWTIAGDDFFRKNWFPLLFLMLCIPAGDTLIPTLQAITADLCTAGLALLGIPAYREGMLLTLPGGNFEVARACSGFRYLNAGIALGALFAYLNLRAVKLMALYVAFVVLVFILMNGIRAFLTILIAAYSDMQYMTGDDHIYFGYVLFAVAIVGVYQVAVWMGRRWDEQNV